MVKNESVFLELEKTDGIFMFLTNHSKENVDANELIIRYFGRNDIEMSFKYHKGALDLQQIFLRVPEGVEAYCFLKILAMLVLNLAAWLLAKYGKKMSPQKLQNELGDMTIVEQRLEPIGVRHWVGANIPTSVDTLVSLFNLPHPFELIDTHLVDRRNEGIEGWEVSLDPARCERFATMRCMGYQWLTQ